MVSPIYDTTNNNTYDQPKNTFPAGVLSHTIDRSSVNGLDPVNIAVKVDMGETAAPKNPPATWSSGPDNNAYLQGK